MYDVHEKSTKEAWLICLILGLIMINFPFIHIFNNDVQFFGIPSLVLYFFVGWPASILVIWLFIQLMKKRERHIDSEQGDS